MYVKGRQIIFFFLLLFLFFFISKNVKNAPVSKTRARVLGSVAHEATDLGRGGGDRRNSGSLAHRVGATFVRHLLLRLLRGGQAQFVMIVVFDRRHPPLNGNKKAESNGLYVLLS